MTTAWRWWLLGGAAMGMGFVADWLEWTMLLAPIPWLHAVSHCDKRRLFRMGTLGGFVFVFVALSWCHETSRFVLVCTSAYFALYWGVWAVMVARIHKHLGVPLWLTAPAVFYSIETLLEHVTLFPVTWLHLGMVSWRVAPLTQVAELAGIQLVSAQLSLFAAGLYHIGCAYRRTGSSAFLRSRSWLPLGLALSSFAVSAAYGTWRLGGLDLTPGLKVALVQGNVPQDHRNRVANDAGIILEHARLSTRARGQSVDLVVWPESTARLFVERDTDLQHKLGSLARSLEAHLLLGSIGLNPEPAPPSNSAFLISPEGVIVGRSDKRVLVPFAETLPVIRHVPAVRDTVAAWLSRKFHYRPNLTPGQGPTILRVAEHRIGVMLCYADTIPGPAEDLMRSGADALITLSNEAWFGTRELDQHLAMATIRSIETRLPMARATNTGLTAIIDPAGRLVDALPRNQIGVLLGTLPMTSLRAIPWWLRRSVSYSLTLACLVAFALTWRPSKT